MAETSIPVGKLGGKGELALFGNPEDATEMLRDHLSSVFSALGCYLSLMDELASDDAAVVAMVGRSLLRQANDHLDRLHDGLRDAGIGIYVGSGQLSLEPKAVTAMTIRFLPGTALAREEV